MSQPRDLIFEIGTEELPSSAVYSAIEQLQVGVPSALDDARLQYGEVTVYATPRRLAVYVSELAERQSDSVTTAKGPAAKAAFDAQGNPTPAAVGFARGKGVPVESLQVVDDENGSYVYATVETVGVEASSVLPGLLGTLIESLEWAKSQRWGSGSVRFPRPVRWLLALHGSDVIPVVFGDLSAAALTYGHRFLGDGAITIASAADYAGALEAGFVVVDQNRRAQLLREGIVAAGATADGQAVIAEKTFAEVVNLVEWPTVGVGTFDEEFLAVPREMLEYAMGGHQRYFAIERADGSLDNRFIVAHNGDPARTDAIIRGHERVIRARLADAAFFYHEDLKLSLEEWLPKLDDVVFQVKLGTVAQKVARNERLASTISSMIGAPADEAAFAQRAAHLAKADLVTNAVVEFTDLQGVIGRYYALHAGEDPMVALAIQEHYRPRFSGDELPSTVAGRIVSIADKLDTICGIFAVGMAPKGSADPFALRRSAIGILQMALGGTRISLDALIAAALDALSHAVEFDVDQTGASVKTFFITRLEKILRDRGHAYDTVEAVLAVAGDDPADALARCEALTAFRGASDAMENLSVAYSRAKNLSKVELGTDADRSLMAGAEVALADALDEAQGAIEGMLAQRAYSAALDGYASLREPIDAFFDAVLVMDPEPQLRDNRLRLLNRFVEVFAGFADFGALSG